jgi:hypothetical protein
MGLCCRNDDAELRKHFSYEKIISQSLPLVIQDKFGDYSVNEY